MLEYIDDLGQTYTENDINRMAAEQKISADAIIKDKKLKQKSAKTTVETKPKAKKLDIIMESLLGPMLVEELLHESIEVDSGQDIGNILASCIMECLITI